ncbi:MAG: hypothetical protein COY75_06995 [Nitrospirae bacterium CG_4_10_14_0_8_um_filter_41_23]|nr:MAG: hypothetical protein COV68_05830 [Nitrospirae bacterium CG11_big_fil_rev_8_21_14_0_20_41_14]PIV44637.1 MAG: hypothetical protein COS27_01230 [Nitrospirae bacterium CG02_land_8_20_14_3_00_41_53]PIY86636.1 MAG: hypothetical protein COY75_06995 [Nitrospirae bacterium CG_4_10_14_0_8_um_filter_41_23]PJA79134.1 MAG: hypothetical protein CO148_09000 [Nitrospirae bacterium CG_4_9_14_3_um_filter_41_27]
MLFIDLLAIENMGCVHNFHINAGRRLLQWKILSENQAGCAPCISWSYTYPQQVEGHFLYELSQYAFIKIEELYYGG